MSLTVAALTGATTVRGRFSARQFPGRKFGLSSSYEREGSYRDGIAGCRRGEREAFHTLFETYQDKIYSIALRFSGNEALAMDIAQDTFLKLFSSMADFRGDSSFGTWVY